MYPVVPLPTSKRFYTLNDGSDVKDLTDGSVVKPKRQMRRVGGSTKRQIVRPLHDRVVVTEQTKEHTTSKTPRVKPKKLTARSLGKEGVQEFGDRRPRGARQANNIELIDFIERHPSANVEDAVRFFSAQDEEIVRKWFVRSGK
jgi:hypothetical protein